MAWRMVKQPNGLFARFSDIVDDFTHMNLSEIDAREVCKQEGCGQLEVEKKMTAAKEDHIPWTTTPGSGLSRWKDCLKTIKTCYDKHTMIKRTKFDMS